MKPKKAEATLIFSSPKGDSYPVRIWGTETEIQNLFERYLRGKLPDFAIGEHFAFHWEGLKAFTIEDRTWEERWEKRHKEGDEWKGEDD